MKWNRYTIETTTAAEDYISPMLLELGIEGVEIEDKVPLSQADVAEMFIDFLPELGEDDGVSHVSFYLEDDGEDRSALLEEVRRGLEELRQVVDIGSGAITSGQTEDLDWMNNWKAFFHSFSVGDILIRPTWEEPEEGDQDRLLIRIDPGMAFGTGKHETTQLCLRQLVRYIRGDGEGLPGMQAPTVLDVGCGSGILSIAALKLGACEVVGTDLDADCIRSTRENLAVNGLDGRPAAFYIGNLIDDAAVRQKVGAGRYDIVVANILAEVLIPMAEVLPDLLKDGGYVITSGIIDFKEAAVRQALEDAGLTVTEIHRQGEWVSITAQKVVG